MPLLKGPRPPPRADEGDGLEAKRLGGGFALCIQAPLASGQAERIEQARSLPLERGLLAYGDKLRRQGAELVGACPQCGGDDRFAVNAAKRLWLCRGCAPMGGDIIDLARHCSTNLTFREALAALLGDAQEARFASSATNRASEGRSPSCEMRASPRADATDVERIAKARRLWAMREPLACSAGELYLFSRDICLERWPPTLGYLPARNENAHALIAAFGMPSEPEPGTLVIADDAVMAVHITKLAPNGLAKLDVKPNKITLGCPKASPIVLAPPNDLLGLVLTEGIEDALSDHEATGLGTWAAGGKTFLPALGDAVPGFVECVTILPDPDGVGHAQKLAMRLRERGFGDVTVKTLSPSLGELR
jgi:hypothetical protein